MERLTPAVDAFARERRVNKGPANE